MGECPAHLLPALERHLMAFVGSAPHRAHGPPARHPLNNAWDATRTALGRPTIHFHDLRRAGLTSAASQGATTRELIARAGHASPAAALRYQHVTKDRDVAVLGLDGCERDLLNAL
jgi:integrase